MKLRPVRIVTTLACGLVLILLSPGYAPAQPSNDVRAKAAQLEKDLEASNKKVAALGEQLSEAQKRVDDAEARVADAEARMKPAKDEIARIKSLINERAASIYKVAGARGPLDAINTEDTKDATARSHYGDVAAGRDDTLIDQLNAAKQEVQAQRDEADRARAEATAERDTVAKDKADADAAAAEQQKLLDQVKGDIEQALRDQTASRVPTAGGPPPVGSGGAGAAVAFANAQVGKAYCNGAGRFGPDCYDCSGLTHSSWAAGGLDIPATSGGQGSAYPHVDVGSLQPGDLITTSSWAAHVGIWVGDGYVHATSYRNNPDAVKFIPGSGSVVDAVRPS
ncbi:MAG TPA: NlpC/P60 family protein [Acidimicrobiia bacterium]